MRFNLLSKGRFYDAQCKNVSDVVLKCVSKENKKSDQLFYSESQYFRENVYHKGVGKAELG